MLICPKQPEYLAEISCRLASNSRRGGCVQLPTELITHRSLQLCPSSLFLFPSPLCVFVEHFPSCQRSARKKHVTPQVAVANRARKETEDKSGFILFPKC